MTDTAVEDEMPEDVGPEWIQQEIWHRYRAVLLEEEIGAAERLLFFWRNVYEQRPDTQLSFRIERAQRELAMLGGWLREEQEGEKRARRHREQQDPETDC